MPGQVRSKEKFPSLVGRPTRYQQNGTGRDIYILTNNGGFENAGTGNSKDFRTAFKESLRGYKINDFYLSRRYKNGKSPPY